MAAAAALSRRYIGNHLAVNLTDVAVIRQLYINLLRCHLPKGERHCPVVITTKLEWSGQDGHGHQYLGRNL
jgi:hypothetical protein